MMDVLYIQGLQQGDEIVFRQVYEQFHEKLYFFICKKSRSAELAEELVQNVFIKLWRYRQSLHEGLPLSQQIFRIAQTCLVDAYRRKRYQDTYILPLEEMHDEIPEETASRQQFKEELLDLKKTFAVLTPVRRQIMEFRLEGFSNQEISDRLSISKKTVENQVNRSVRLIKEHKSASLLLLVMLTDPFL